MRVQADTRVLDITPGSSVDVNLDVVNTTEVIDGVTARIIGIEPEHVKAHPDLLSLFPDTSGRLTLTLGLPLQFPAGRHPVTVEVASSTGAGDPHHVDLDLLVASHPAIDLTVRPAVLRTRRRGSFSVHVANRGNVPLEVALSAVDADRSLRYSFEPSTVEVAPGSSSVSTLSVRGPRMLVGSEVDRPLPIRGDGDAVGLTSGGDAGGLTSGGDAVGLTSGGDAVADETIATLRQRPIFSRGLLTVLILMSIVGLWALAFLLGLTKVFSGDPLTKTAPASFFASAVTGGAAGARAGGAPSDVLPKSGVLPPGVGGAISGTVTATSTGNGVGRIVVEALRQSKDGLKLVTSAATQTDGTYSLVGLFPGTYLLRFSAPGYVTVWYPAASAQGGATSVKAVAQQVSKGTDVKITGKPASISGQVDPGDTLTPVTTTVSVRALESASSANGAVGATGNTGGTAAPTSDSPIIATVTTDASGHYEIPNLPAPNTYELGFVTPGYQPTTIVDKVGGGQQRSEPIVRLRAATGSISGTVTDGTNPLGGVAVATTVDGQEVKTATPTVGTVGAFTVPGLQTPGTYILTFTKDQYSSQTVAVDLGPGEQKAGLSITLVGGTGTASGTVVDANGKGLGGATVTVGGLTKPVSTTTLTTGSVGSFVIAGLPTPGSYTLTFTLAGYQSQTVPVVLDGDHPAGTVQLTLTPSVGSITGKVCDLAQAGGSCTPDVGATITVTDGKHIRTTTSVNSPVNGGYVVSDLPPGAYSVTVSKPGFVSQTALVFAVAGQPVTQDLSLRIGSGG
jgi:hypothetical protein